jgi:predicted RNase H-like HicB family nuclease
MARIRTCGTTLPGCYPQAETVDELKSSIRKANVGVLEVLKEQGREPGSRIQILRNGK